MISSGRGHGLTVIAKFTIKAPFGSSIDRLGRVDYSPRKIQNLFMDVIWNFHCNQGLNCAAP